MLAEPTVVQRADQPYVAIRTLVTMETLGAVVPPLNREVFGWLAARGAAATGARLEIYESDPAQEPDMDKWVTELAFRLAG